MTITDLANRALGMLGNQFITAIDDGSIEAEACSRNLQSVIRLVGSQHEWTTMRSVAKLNQLAIPSALGYTYVYQLPEDLITVVGTLGAKGIMDKSEYRQIRDQLHSEVEDLCIEYVVYDRKVGYWSAPLFEYMATQLAWHIANAVSAEAQVVAQIPQLLQIAREAAMYHEATLEDENSSKQDAYREDKQSRINRNRYGH